MKIYVVFLAFISSVSAFAYQNNETAASVIVQNFALKRQVILSEFKIALEALMEKRVAESVVIRADLDRKLETVNTERTDANDRFKAGEITAEVQELLVSTYSAVAEVAIVTAEVQLALLRETCQAEAERLTAEAHAKLDALASGAVAY